MRPLDMVSGCRGEIMLIAHVVWSVFGHSIHDREPLVANVNNIHIRLLRQLLNLCCAAKLVVGSWVDVQLV